MPLGPIDLLVVKFPGNRFSGEILPALADLVDAGTIRIVDCIVAIRDDAGDLAVVDFGDLDEDAIKALAISESELSRSLTEEDAIALSDRLEPGSSIGILLYENTWATRVADALRNASGELVMHERIPRAVIDEMIASVTE
jgi:Family of unknown function (DUF6325)